MPGTSLRPMRLLKIRRFARTAAELHLKKEVLPGLRRTGEAAGAVWEDTPIRAGHPDAGRLKAVVACACLVLSVAVADRSLQFAACVCSDWGSSFG